MPFHCMKGVKLEQPIFGGNYLTGQALAQPDGNFNGDVTWRLTFNRGGCIDFGQALLKANDMGMGHPFFLYGPFPDKARRRGLGGCPICCCIPFFVF